ncbi:MAG: hypothetical protein AAGG51_09040 [Cyanobacteria bacterium P01_G01_bin.54]
MTEFRSHRLPWQRTRSPSTPLSRFMAHLERIPLLAHHPTCRHYNHHLIRVGSVALCLGCTMMACGILAGAIAFYLSPSLRSLHPTLLILLGVLLYSPAIGQIWWQTKPYKLLARFSLGLSVASLLYSGLIALPWSGLGLLLRLGFIIEFIAVWRITLKVRSRFSKSPCTNCPDGRFPICNYTLNRLPAAIENYFTGLDGRDPQADEFVTGLQYVARNNPILPQWRRDDNNGNSSPPNTP